MDTGRWEKIEDIGARAAELTGAERDHYLLEACGGDEALRSEIESLLEQVDAGESFMGAPLVDPGDATALRPEDPTRVGDFQILGVLGQGGMGTVYEARREGEGFAQRVALKLLRSRLVTGALVDRFMTERRILAVLEHPGIARFIDGGTTDAGHPYVAMEFVEGLPLNEYCATKGLKLEATLEVFDQVCQAVQHAHENLVVHRDLKPSNILVTETGQPKLLDFGISKLIDPEEVAQATQTGEHVLTPLYAAPEQLLGDSITTATDVYALGIVLYELLTGAHPYDRPGQGTFALHTATLTEEVERPSERLGKEAEVGEGPSVSGRNVAWRRRIAGDLDSVVLHALKKEPERRYPTVAALRTDLTRWQGGHPVSAQPDSSAYRFRKFVSRNRLAVGVVSAAFVLVSASAIFSGFQFRRAEQEAVEARAERDRAEGVVSFLTGLFEWADPNRALGADVTARALLDAGAARVDSAFQGSPDLQASLYGTIAPIYTRIGLHQEAEEAARSALAAGVGVLDREEAARHVMDLARGLHGQRRYDEAEQAFRLAVDTLGLERDSEVGARALSLLGGFYAERRTNLEEAEVLLDESIEAYGSIDRGRSPNASIAIQALAMVYQRVDRLEEAMDLQHEALAIVQDSLGEIHTRTAAVLNSIGSLEFMRQDFDASADYLRRALDIREQILGATHEDMGSSWFNLGQVLFEAGRMDEGSDAYRRSLEIRVSAQGEDDIRVANTRYNYGYYLSRSAEDYEAAVEQLRGAGAAYRAVGGDAHPQLTGVTTELAFALSSLNRWAEAETLLVARHRWADAEGVDLEPIRVALVGLYERWGVPDRAAPFRTPPL